MSMIFLPVNAQYAFLFGDALIRLEGESLFYPTRCAAIEAAKRHGLSVNGKGRVS